MIISMLVLFVCVFLILLFNKRIKPLLIHYAEQQIKLETSLLAVTTIEETILNDNINYEDLIITVTNSREEITAIDFNTIKINKMLNSLTTELIQNLNKLEDVSFSNNNSVYYIPLGIITGLSSSNWIGPQIPIKVMTTGSIETNLNTSMKAYGINNVLLEIYISIKINTKILLPLTNKQINVVYDMPLIKKVIQGKIPEIYGGFYTNSSNIYKELLEANQ